MGRSDENTSFDCAHCGASVCPLSNGSYRNHCPECLWSLHVDVRPGDRASACAGLMAPVGLKHSSKGWQVVHECLTCGVVRANRIADRTDQPDEIDVLVALMRASPVGQR